MEVDHVRLVAIVVAVAAVMTFSEPPPETRERRRHHRDFVLYQVPNMSDLDFKRTFRLSRNVLRWLADDIGADPCFSVHPQVAHMAHRPDLLLAIAVYRLGHAISVHQIAQKFSVGEAIVNAATWTILPLVVARYRAKWIEGLWPWTYEQRASIAKHFYEKKSCGIEHCNGALDGTHVPIYVPDEGQAETYHNYKHFYSLTFLHVVDPMRRHMYISGGVGGSQGDKSMFAQSSLWANIQSYLPAPWMLLSDGGILHTLQVLCPYNKPRGGAITASENFFNQRLSSGRVVVEMAFGITKCRFRIFLGKTGVKFRTTPGGLTAVDKYRTAWLAACIFHNMARTEAMSMDASDPFEAELATMEDFEKQVRFPTNARSWTQTWRG